ncbi:MAG: Ku protein, partial [Acidobacteria bacterium]|nr:Ku protein [Acidobacteriota bacterium]
KQQLYSPELERIVERKELVKGYEVAKDQYLIIDPEDLKKVAPESSSTMEILEFVKLDEVDPLYFDSSYLAVPEDAGRKPYALLVKAMEETGYCAIAKLSMHQREYTVVLRPRKGGLTLHTMFYEDEVRDSSEYGHISDVEIKESEEKLARQLIESLAAHFDVDKYHDEYRSRVEGLIEAKRQGQEAEAAQEPRLAPVIDLMEALQRSLAERPEKKAAAQAAASTGPKAVKKKSSSG